MEWSPSQKESQIAASIPALGEDVLLLRHMIGNEQVGRLFEYDLELLSEDHRIKLKDVIGHRLTVRLEMRDDETRFFNGHVARFTYAGTQGEYARYRATVRPWLWFLTLTNDCRIFQDMTVPEIVEDTFRRRGFADFKMNLTAQYRPREYATQYIETDFNFVSRLMENEGIFYYFEHEDGKHTVVVCDGDGILDHRPPTPGYEEVPYLAAEGTDHVMEHISDWVVSQQVSPGGVHLKDFDFQGPRNSLEAKVPVHSDLLAEGVPSQSNLEIYDYPARYQAPDEAEIYARMRMEEIEAQYEVADGRTNARGLAVGGTFTMVDHPRDEENREYVVLSAVFELYSDAYGTEDTGAVKPTFRCDFKAMDARRNYRLPRTTPRPVVQGPQTAIVVGPRGEKIWPDKYGRVKVQFHWDRHGQRDENSSCWIRVSQNWAGGSWGAMSIPHIGHEVVVEFLEGNPDRPLITGRVYNADNMPPMPLPDNKHRSILSDDYGNQLIFDATPGDEHITLYSPHHGSGLVLGRSSWYSSESDSGELYCGDKTETFAGFKSETSLSSALEATVGVGTSFMFGTSMGFSAGWTAEIVKGRKVDITFEDNIDSSEEDFLLQADEQGLIDAEKALVLVSGGHREAKIDMSDTGLGLFVGAGAGRRDPVKEAQEKRLKIALGICMATSGAAIIAQAGMNIARYSDLGSNPTADEKDAADQKMSWGSYFGHGAAIIASIVATALTHKLTSLIDPAELISQVSGRARGGTTTPQGTYQAKAKFELDARDGAIRLESMDGTLNIKSKGALNMESQDSISIKSDKDIRITAPNDKLFVGKLEQDAQGNMKFNGKKVQLAATAIELG